MCALFDACCEVDGDPGDVSVVVSLDLAGVDARPNVDADAAKLIAQ